MHDINIELIRAEEGPIIYMIGDNSSAIKAAEHMKTRCTLVAVTPPDWNGSLSPWPAPKCFREGEAFAGGADVFISQMLEDMPGFEKSNGLYADRRGICGYSLAGLCALYCLYASDAFDGAASASGSMWFDGWQDFMEASDADMTGKHVYLSVGDREKLARNERLSKVEKCTIRAREILAAKGADVFFELNPGNHFRDVDLRLARGTDWLQAALSKG